MHDDECGKSVDLPHCGEIQVFCVGEQPPAPAENIANGRIHKCEAIVPPCLSQTGRKLASRLFPQCFHLRVVGASTLGKAQAPEHPMDCLIGCLESVIEPSGVVLGTPSSRSLW